MLKVHQSKLSTLKLSLVILTIFLIKTPCYADTFILKNGDEIVGDLVIETEKYYIVATEDQGELPISKDSVDKFIKDAISDAKESTKEYLKEIPIDKMVAKLIEGYQMKPIDKEIPSIAVIPFQSKDLKIQKEKIGFGIAEVISDNLVDNWVDKFNILERAKLKEVLQEQALSLTGIISEKTAVMVGKLMEADMLLMGSVTQMGKNYFISSRLVNVTTGEIIAAQSITTPTEKFKKEAKEYIDLPKSWGVYYGIVYLGLEPDPNTPESSNDPFGVPDNQHGLNNRLDYDKFVGLVFGLRKFITGSLQVDIGATLIQIAGGRHTLDTEYTVTGTDIPIQYVGSPIAEMEHIYINIAKENKTGYWYLGGGMTMVISKAGDQKNIAILPGIKAGYELRIQERIGIELSALYFLSSETFTMGDDMWEEVSGFKLFTIKPLSFGLRTTFYF